jgi:AAA15 family ATPase/GTPase
LLLGGDFTSDQEPEKRFGQGFLTTISSGQFLLALGDGLATETDTLFSIKNRAFPDKTLDTTHTTISHVNGNLTEDIATMLGLESLNLLLLLRDEFSETLLQRLQIEMGSFS